MTDPPPGASPVRKHPAGLGGVWCEFAPDQSGNGSGDSLAPLKERTGMPFIGDVLPELDAATFDPDTDIKELFELSGTQPGGGDTFSLESAEGVLVFLIDWRKARAFTRWVLGFSYADEVSPFKLRRENPQMHPRFPKLSAATVHFSSVAPKANTDTGVPARAPNYPAVFTLPGALNKMGFYDSCYCTVRYVQRPWDFRPDGYVDVPTDELDRNCYVTALPVVELLNAEGGTSQLLWEEGDAVAASADKPKQGEAITNIFATRISKIRYILNWMWVPESYLSRDVNVFFAEKLWSCIGKVNSTPFLGRPAGTLLCDAPKMDRFQFPVSAFDGLNGFFGWNIQLPLTYFNPTLGVPESGDPLLDNTKARGHRTLPWRGSNTWFGAEREKPGVRLLEEADFSVMLEHISAP
jgi:hypothetical protein